MNYNKWIKKKTNIAIWNEGDRIKMKTKLDKIADKELNGLRKKCIVNGIIIRERVDEYSDLIRKYHFAGVNVNLHAYRLCEFYKELSAQEREKINYESMGVCLGDD